MREHDHKHHWIGCIAMIILIIGGLNWGIIGLFNVNIVHEIFRWEVLERIIYILVGLSAIYWIFGSIHCCKKHKCGINNTPPGPTVPPSSNNPNI